MAALGTTSVFRAAAASETTGSTFGEAPAETCACEAAGEETVGLAASLLLLAGANDGRLARGAPLSRVELAAGAVEGRCGTLLGRSADAVVAGTLLGRATAVAGGGLLARDAVAADGGELARDAALAGVGWLARDVAGVSEDELARAAAAAGAADGRCA